MTLGDLQTQVELIVGHRGLASYVTTWCNRTCAEIMARAYWSIQMKQSFIQPTAVVGTQNSNWVGTNNLSHQDVMAIHHIFHFQGAYTTPSTIATPEAVDIQSEQNPLVRLNVNDFIGMLNQGYVTETGSQIQYYCVPFWTPAQISTYGDGAIKSVLYPLLALYPHFSNTTQTQGGLLAVHHLQAVTEISGTAQETWMMDKYPLVVLAGVLRYARLYLGDAQGYLVEKGEFENGIIDMLKNEETIEAQAPVRRMITPSDLEAF